MFPVPSPALAGKCPSLYPPREPKRPVLASSLEQPGDVPHELVFRRDMARALVSYRERNQGLLDTISLCARTKSRLPDSVDPDPDSNAVVDARGS